MNGKFKIQMYNANHKLLHALSILGFEYQFPKLKLVKSCKFVQKSEVILNFFLQSDDFNCLQFSANA